MNGLRELLWKDARMSRAYLIVVAGVLAAPYLFLAYIRYVADRGLEWDATLHYAGMTAGLGAIIVASLLSGASLATERTDRSIEFLAYLPLTRPTRLLSKLAVVFTPVVVLCLANPLILLDAIPNGWPAVNSANGSVLLTLMVSTLLVVGIAWLGSSLAGPASALLLGLLAPFFLTCLYFGGVIGIEELFGTKIDLDDWFAPVYRWAALGSGFVGLLLGSRIYLSRKET